MAVGLGQCRRHESQNRLLSNPQMFPPTIDESDMWRSNTGLVRRFVLRFVLRPTSRRARFSLFVIGFLLVFHGLAQRCSIVLNNKWYLGLVPMFGA